MINSIGKNYDYIGPDPVSWVYRLLDVAEQSKFTDEQKIIIREHLSNLVRRLEQL
jgi:hypothetical protein